MPILSMTVTIASGVGFALDPHMPALDRLSDLAWGTND